MIAWLILNLWHALSLIVFLGPLFWCIHQWETSDRRREAAHLEAGLPAPAPPAHRTAIRVAIGLAAFLAGGYVGHIMYEASGALYAAVSR
jgi:hypothetical protein